MILHVVPGPSVKEKRKLRSFTFTMRDDLKLISNFKLEQFIVLPAARKAFFHGHDYVGELSLEDYPFQTPTNMT